jgi:hypothetical protein
MLTISSLVPNPEDLLALEVEELAGILLMHLNSREDGGAGLNHYNFFNDFRSNPVYPRHKDKVNLALMEAWDWLANEGFLAKRGDDYSRAGMFVTRRGQRMKSREDFAAFRKANLLPNPTGYSSNGSWRNRSRLELGRDCGIARKVRTKRRGAWALQEETIIGIQRFNLLKVIMCAIPVDRGVRLW